MNITQPEVHDISHFDLMKERSVFAQEQPEWLIGINLPGHT